MKVVISLDYLAAFIDGEGTISIGKPHENSFNLYISVCNTNKRVIQIINENFGGNFVEGKIKKTKYYKNTWYGKESQEILKLVYDKLIIKKIRAEFALGFPIGDFKNKGEYFQFSNLEKELRNFIYENIKKLNKFGENE